MYTRPNYQVQQTSTKTFSYGKYVRVRLENLPVPTGEDINSLVRVQIDNNPSVPLTQKQIEQVAMALEFDDTVQQVISLLEKNVIHGDVAIRKNLCSLFKN